MAQYKIYNFAMVTTAQPTPVTTGTSLKTLLQVKPSATASMKVLEWGIDFDGSVAATPIMCELLETDVAAKVTACVANDIIKYDGIALNGGDPTTNLIQVGTSSTGYTASAEGTTTASRLFDCQQVAPSSQYVMKFDAGREPVVQISKFLRIRVKAGTAVNAKCYVLVEI